MMSEDDQVKVPLGEAVRMFQDLEECVVSFDRILSRIGAGADPAILVDHFADRQVPSRLAHLRGFLGDLIEEKIGAEALEDIAEGVYVYTDDVGREGKGDV